MNINDLTKQQKEAILDLLVLAMYADSHLASVENARVQSWLTMMGIESEVDRNKQYDASVTRIRPHTETGWAAGVHARTLSLCFTTPEHRRWVYNALEDLLKSDSLVGAKESGFLIVARESFEV
jgi:hypothetical protein